MKCHKVFLSCLVCVLLIGCAPAEVSTPTPSDEPEPAASISDDGYVSLFNGVSLDGWKPIVRSGDPELALKVFAPGEGGTLHIYRDLPDGYQLGEETNDTHGVILIDTASNASTSGERSDSMISRPGGTTPACGITCTPRKCGQTDLNSRFDTTM
jgi:hypothetical protein